VERAPQRRPRSRAEHEQAYHDQPYGEAGDVAGAHFKAAAAQRQPNDQRDWR
jgi:hypothetical protein